MIADQCTDRTAEVSRQAGAIVYQPFNKVQVGKGICASITLFRRIFEDQGEQAYEGFFVFDARTIWLTRSLCGK